MGDVSKTKSTRETNERTGKRKPKTCALCGGGRALVRLGRYRLHTVCVVDLIESEIQVIREEAAWQNGGFRG